MTQTPKYDETETVVIKFEERIDYGCFSLRAIKQISKKQFALKVLGLSALLVPATVVLAGLLSANTGCAANQICAPDFTAMGNNLFGAIGVGFVASILAVWLAHKLAEYPQTQHIVVD
jgi:hypothetical protein